jgi:hypothetical protein
VIHCSTPSVDGGTNRSLSSDARATDDASGSDASTIQSNRTTRPIGNKKAKELASIAREDKKFKEAILAVHKDLAKQTQDQNRILSNQSNLISTLADDVVMKIDLSTCNPTNRPYYEWQQKKVLDKMKREKEEFEKMEEERKKKEEEEKRKIDDDKKKQKEGNKSTEIELIEDDEEDEEGEEGEEDKEDKEGEEE